jgi:O-antigen biosynthesis protein
LRRVAIYTAIFGDYDELKAPVAQDIDCDFFCFTDQVKPRKLHPWRTISVRRMASLSPRMQAKWFKVANHHVFPSGRLKMGFAVRAGHLLGGSRYEATIWVDGSLRIKGPMMAREIAGLVTDGSMAVFKHPDRDCLYEEVAASLPIKSITISRCVSS